MVRLPPATIEVPARRATPKPTLPAERFRATRCISTVASISATVAVNAMRVMGKATTFGLRRMPIANIAIRA
jgi:hypothetical protein